MEKILIKDLSFAYPDEPEKLIIKDINLEIEQGEFVCLLGQSGCGKSTLLKLLAGLQKPSQGEITIDGDPIKGAKDTAIALRRQQECLIHIMSML